jgi:hypothetical protein
MGWKSTIEITREEAIRLIQKRTLDEVLQVMSNKELELIVEGMGYGDNPDWKYFGHNFFVVNEIKEYEDE